jgi:hypothetical protein
MTLANDSDDALKKRADASFRKEKRVEDGKKGAADYEAASRAVAAKTARLRALRLAKEAADKAQEAANPVKPATKKRTVRSTSWEHFIAGTVAVADAGLAKEASRPLSASKAVSCIKRLTMPDDLSAEFESYRRRLGTEEEKITFDRKIKQLLAEHGVDYVRGYVDGLKDHILK